MWSAENATGEFANQAQFHVYTDCVSAVKT